MVIMMMEARGLMLMLFWFFTFTAFLLDVTHGIGRSFHCVQFGQGDETRFWHEWSGGKNTRPGIWTIGTKPMDARWLAAFSATYRGDGPAQITSPEDAKCPWRWAPVCRYPGPFQQCVRHKRIEACVASNLIRMNIYLVKQGNRILQGWLHIEIELLDQTEKEIELIYIQMRDDKLNAVGEFVNAEVVPGAVCNNLQGSALSVPTKYQLYPCGVAGPHDAKVPQGIMMAKKEFYFKGGDFDENTWLHAKPIRRGVHVLWRTNEYWCNRHAKFQPFAYILTKTQREKYKTDLTGAVQGKNDDEPFHGEVLFRKLPSHWIYTKWFGAADIILNRGEDPKLDCSELVFQDNSGALTTAAANSWIRQTTPLLFKEDNWNPARTNFAGTYIPNVCQVHPRDGDDKNYPTFVGRCSDTHQTASDKNFMHECNTDPNSPEFQGVNTTQFQTHDKYISKKKEDRGQFCNIKCRKPETQEDYDGIMSFPPLNDTVDDVAPNITVGKNDFRTRSKFFKLRAARRYHGICFCFLAFFITPVSVFVARNYKETFMRRRCYGLHVWYWTHIGGIVATFCLALSGHSALSQFFRVWGKSTTSAARFHRIFGYSSLLTFLFLVVFGGLRIRAPGIGRKVTMTLHALMGFAHLWLNLVAVIYSTWIPMSPSLKGCDLSGMPEGMSKIFWLAAGWIAIDFIFHLLLTVLHIHRDRLIGTCRSWYFPIVPLVNNNQMVDMKGEEIRKIFLWIYIAVSLVAAITASIIILRNTPPKHCLFGNSTCESWAGCTQLAKKYAEWVHLQGGT